jgi:hypothetical protein
MNPTDKTPEISATRFQITEDDIRSVFFQLQKKTASRLNEKGCGIIISRHEMLGVVAEEYAELINAVQEKGLSFVADELIDIGVACIVSLASIRTGKVQW